jgi:hypothetical protein
VSKAIHGSLQQVLIFKLEKTVLKQVIQGRQNLRLALFVSPVKDPDKLANHQRRDKYRLGSRRAILKKMLDHLGLVGVVIHHQTNEDVRIGGSHFLERPLLA